MSSCTCFRYSHAQRQTLKSLQRKSLPALLMFLNFATGTFSFSPCKKTKIQPACPLSLGACSVGGAIARGPVVRSLREFWRRGKHELNWRAQLAVLFLRVPLRCRKSTQTLFSEERLKGFRHGYWSAFVKWSDLWEVFGRAVKYRHYRDPRFNPF